jgi:hypothetical protein
LIADAASSGAPLCSGEILQARITGYPLVLSLPPWSRYRLAPAGFSVDSAED